VQCHCYCIVLVFIRIISHTFVVTRLYLDTAIYGKYIINLCSYEIASFVFCIGSTASEAKRKSLVDENGEVAKDKVMNMLYDELRTW